MSPIQACAIALRLFAIWLAIYWARWVPYLYSEARKPDDAIRIVVALAVTALAIAFVLLLWFFPRVAPAYNRLKFFAQLDLCRQNLPNSSKRPLNSARTSAPNSRLR